MTKYRLKSETQNTILTFLWTNRDYSYTRKQIAELALNRVKSPAFIEKLEELVTLGYIAKAEENYKNTSIFRYYAIKE